MGWSFCGRWAQVQTKWRSCIFFLNTRDGEKMYDHQSSVRIVLKKNWRLANGVFGGIYLTTPETEWIKIGIRCVNQTSVLHYGLLIKYIPVQCSLSDNQLSKNFKFLSILACHLRPFWQSKVTHTTFICLSHTVQLCKDIVRNRTLAIKKQSTSQYQPETLSLWWSVL